MNKEDKFQMLRNKYTDTTKFSNIKIDELLEYLKMKRERERDDDDSNFVVLQNDELK